MRILLQLGLSYFTWVTMTRIGELYQGIELKRDFDMAYLNRGICISLPATKSLPCGYRKACSLGTEACEVLHLATGGLLSDTGPCWKIHDEVCILITTNLAKGVLLMKRPVFGLSDDVIMDLMDSDVYLPTMTF